MVGIGHERALHGEGSRSAFSIWLSAPGSASMHHDANGAGASRSVKTAGSGGRAAITFAATAAK